MNNNKKKITDLNLQLFFSTLFILTIIVSMTITYNQKHFLETGEKLISDDVVHNIVLINRVIIICLLFGYLYIDFDSYSMDLEEGKGTKGDTLEVIASVLSISAGIVILLAIIFYYYENEDVSYENPTI